MTLTPQQLGELEENERWLSRQPTPLPSGELLGRIRMRVQLEARAQSLGSHEAPRGAAWGALAAAALILLSAGLLWHAERSYVPGTPALRGPVAAASDDPFERFAVTAEALVNEDAELEDMKEEVSSLASGWAGAGDASLDRLLSDMDRLEYDAEQSEGL